MQVTSVAAGTHAIDTLYLGRQLGIAACVIEGTDGVLLVDPGPASSLAGLRAGLAGLGIGVRDVTDLLLTHIHLDHAGATGTLVAEHPDLRVHVHARGAVHLADPTRLLDSALRIYGAELDRLFGAMVPVPQDRIRPLAGGERLRVAGRTVHVTDAPGHASHHVVYLDEVTGTAFVGDTGGERFAPAEYVLPVTPPPDIDVEAWHATLAKLREQRPERLFLTHFGAAHDAIAHLDRLGAELDVWAERVRVSLEEGVDDAARAGAFAERVREDIRARVPAALQPHYMAGGLTDSWHGLARYWRKRAG